MKIPTPEEFLKNNFLKDLSTGKISASFRCELRWLSQYKTIILTASDNDFNVVMGKINFLVNACLKKDQNKIDQWLSQYGKISSDDSFGMDWKKVLEEAEK